ncbi:scavenger receptor cysteine-rich type 1 protein M160 [Cottoperca gobio]|uniref:Scavenger receptor cysteine-rich type 1 protein M160 n=1 Tax=Cottoperca gobio TaxID=56716 RepID=A0A6J2Q018_COTGO|nr:scavenger receptor cysteine-rich type 1 protein M160-like [Cottoperca gobio]
MMWFLLLLLYTAHIERVIAQGDNRLILMNGSNPCEGHIRIYHKSKLGYVGDTFWSMNNAKVVCRSTHCDEPVSTYSDYTQLPIGEAWLNEVNCTGEERHLTECTYPGWGIKHFTNKKLIKIECSNKIHMSLDGFRCAGAVQYSTDREKTSSGYLCGDSGWGKKQKDADLLCKNLNCGGYKEIPKVEWMVWKSFKDFKKMSIDCSGIGDVTNLWQCATKELPSCKSPASVICTDHEKLQLSGNTSNVCSGRLEKLENDIWEPVKDINTTPDVRCKQMYCGTAVKQSPTGKQLTCTDNVKVVLMDKGNTSQCYGAVYIEVNNARWPVCASTWTDKEAEVVCRELNCGRMISKYKNTNKILNNGIMDNVECSAKESSLWHCRAKRDKDHFKCSSHAYVDCAGSLDVRLMDSPGKCAGRVEIQHKGLWHRVDKKQWTSINSNVVCRQQGCGNYSQEYSTSHVKFSQGSGDFLAKNVNCQQNAENISECITGDIQIPKSTAAVAVGITCDDHKVVFLKGSCSGEVAIEHRNKTFWLSGSKETWNQKTANIVCRQMRCGKASHFTTSNTSMMEDVWNESYRCSPNTTSLFDCETTTRPSDHNASVAIVECSGKIKVNLTNKCWGHVHFCVDGKCGGVCNDTWTDHHSLMLCKNLDCGDQILHLNAKPEQYNVAFKGLYPHKNWTNLAECNAISFKAHEDSCKTNPAYVVCSGSVMARFNTTRDKCSGNLQMYNDGQWLPVCKEALQDSNIRNIICRELSCSQNDLSTNLLIEYFGPQSAGGRIISKIQCSGKSLTACTMTLSEDKCPLGAIQCSSWSKLTLSGSKACSGSLFVDTHEKTSHVSIEGWTEIDGNRVCQDLECGKLKSNKTTISSSRPTTSFSCAAVENPKNIWACEKDTSLQSETNQTLFIECQDEPKVTLSDECHGEVRINDIGVCDSHWKKEYSGMVCQQQGCSYAIDGLVRVKLLEPDKQYHHVSCEHNHVQMGECKRFLAKCDGNLVSIHCVNDVKFNTTEKCGGQIQVNYGDNWEKVCPLTESFPKKLLNSEMLCENTDCKGYNNSINKNNKQVSMGITLICDNANDIKYCVQRKTCDGQRPAEIYCNGYVEKVEPTGKPAPNLTVTIILVLGFILVLVILIVIFVRICIVNKAKAVSTRMLARKEVEFESGDYDDVMEKSNEMEDRSQASFREEVEVKSTSFNSYNNMDDVAETEPLTGQAATFAASGGNYVDEVPLDHISDGVTYEVDDPQENYDDIEAFPAITQTEAEVHDSPQVTPESDAAEPVGLVEGDDDYLVPG